MIGQQASCSHTCTCNEMGIVPCTASLPSCRSCMDVRLSSKSIPLVRTVCSQSSATPVTWGRASTAPVPSLASVVARAHIQVGARQLCSCSGLDECPAILPRHPCCWIVPRPVHCSWACYSSLRSSQGYKSVRHSSVCQHVRASNARGEPCSTRWQCGVWRPSREFSLRVVSAML